MNAYVVLVFFMFYSPSYSQDYPNEDMVNIQFRMDPSEMGFLHPLMRIFSSDAYPQKRGRTTNDSEERSGVVYKNYYNIHEDPDRIVIKTNDKGADCPIFCSLFGMFRPSEVEKMAKEEGANITTTENEDGTTIVVQKPKPRSDASVEKDIKNAENALDKALRGIENAFGQIFTEARYHRRENSTETLVPPEPKPTEQTKTVAEEPTIPSNEPNEEKTHAKLQELEKRLSQVLGMVEKLENENGRLKKIVTGMINGN